MKKTTIAITLLLLLFTVSCKPENELTLERGNYFYEQKDFHEAANQYNKVILNAISKKSLNEKETAILAHAYQQKSLCYAQLAESVNDIDTKKMYYQDALKDIKKACDLATKSNKREEYLKTQTGILKKSEQYSN